MLFKIKLPKTKMKIWMTLTFRTTKESMKTMTKAKNISVQKQGHTLNSEIYQRDLTKYQKKEK